MASTLSDLLGIFGQSTGQTMGGDLALTRESPSTYAQLFTGTPKEESFWAKPGGKALGSILSVLGTGGIGALLGLLGSPEARGLGAARGAAMGAGAGAMMDIGQRRAASQIPTVESKLQQLQEDARLDRDLKLKIAQMSSGSSESPMDKILAQIIISDWQKSQQNPVNKPSNETTTPVNNKLTQDDFDNTFLNKNDKKQTEIKPEVFGPQSNKISENYDFYNIDGPIDNLDSFYEWLDSSDEDID